MTRDTDARHLSDARAREMGCSTALAAIALGGLIAFIVSRIFFNA